ncbi:SRPBCC family protein [Reyranella sp.]|uniref:SRPBCC family protein n=1 Tax=Reyranella sp. TaxID=1929291 RepID=UPI00272F28B7|nr:SRPBCC family protein [Reyranella sp.]MDP2375193.1 SRPBCC family protein [Reyranella sp.]
MSEDAQFTHAHMVRFERLLPGPVERTWQVLTEVNRLPGWYGESHIEPRTGGTVSLMGGHIRGTVTQYLPPQRLAYSWNVFNPGDEVSPYPESYLSLELKPAGDDTALTLTHLPVLERFVKLNAMGWHTYLDMMAAALRGEPVAPRDAYMTRNAKLYGIDLANPLG